MGGGGGDTNVTNTGLGDEQFNTLTANQDNIASSFDLAQADAKTAYDTLYGRFDTTDTSLANLNSKMGTNYTNLNNTLDALNTRNKAERKAYAEFLANNSNTNRDTITQTVSGLSDDITGGFSDQEARFNTIDSSLGDNLDAINANNDAIGDVQTTANTINNNTSGLAGNLSDLSTDQAKGFADAADAVTKGFTGVNENVAGARGDLVKGQSGLETDISGLGDSLDTYAGSIIEKQGQMESAADDFRTNFDTYVERYGDDVERATKARADIAEAQAKGISNIRDDVGAFAGATAKGQSELGQRLGNLGEQTDTGFQVLSNAVEGGFSSVAAGDQVSRDNLATRIGNVKDLLVQTGDSIDAATKSQYQALANSFDENGDLITNAIDENGNTIQRSMDETGSIIEQRFDSTGAEISTVQMDVETMLQNAETYQNSVMGSIAGLSADQQEGFGEVARGQEGLMAESTTNQGLIQDQLSATAQGFNETDKMLDIQTRDLARIASTQSEVDMATRQEFKQISDAFDDQGRLITNSVNDNGTSVARAVDENGNLLLRAFDAQGRQLGDRVININRSLATLSDLANVAGANSSMGNLSPAMQAGEGGVKGVRSGTIWTRAEAEEKLLEAIREHEHVVKQHVTVPLTQGQYDALTSFVYNLGAGNFRSSTLLKKLNQGLYDEVPEQLMRWNKARVDGKLTPLKGLTRRRAAEAAIFSADAKLPSEQGGPIAPQKVEATAQKPLAKSKTMAGAGIAGAATALGEITPQIEALVPYSDSMKTIFLLCAIGGIALAAYARFKDHKEGVH